MYNCLPASTVISQGKAQTLFIITSLAMPSTAHQVTGRCLLNLNFNPCFPALSYTSEAQVTVNLYKVSDPPSMHSHLVSVRVCRRHNSSMLLNIQVALCFPAPPGGRKPSGRVEFLEETSVFPTPSSQESLHFICFETGCVN